MADETPEKQATPETPASPAEAKAAPAPKAAAKEEPAKAAPVAEEPKSGRELLAEPEPVRETPAAAKKRRKSSKHVPVGIAYIRASFNNTNVTITDMQGNVISWSSSGRCGFKGSRKSTAYAASMVSQDAARQAAGHGMREVEVRVQGPGAGRESAVRALQSAGLTVSSISDVTPIPHNGCRAPKRRRV